LSCTTTHTLSLHDALPIYHRHLVDIVVLQQHVFDFARIDVGTAADDHILRPVPDGEEPVLVQRADVAGMQPASAQRLRGGLGISDRKSTRLNSSHVKISYA